MRKTFKTLLLALPLAAASLMAHAADSPVGRWTTIDDETASPNRWCRSSRPPMAR